MLISGNEAIVMGCLNSGVKYFTGYPGTPCTEIGEMLSNYTQVNTEWSINEKVALEVATGISYSGNRVLIGMKTLGLNVAADCLSQIAGTPINGGIVLVVADDVGRIAADDYQDCRFYGRAFSIPILEPSDSKDAFDMTKLAFEISENFCTPVIIRMNSITCKSSLIIDHVDMTFKDIEIHRKYKRSLQKTIGNIVRFGFKKYNMDKLKTYWIDFEENKRKLKDFVQKIDINFHIKCNSKIGVIACGNAYNYAAEIGDKVGILKLGLSFPLPEKMLDEFFYTYDKVYILEDGFPVVEQEIKKLGYRVIGEESFPRFPKMLFLTSEIVEEKILGNKNINSRLSVPFRLPENCKGCPHNTITKVIKHTNIHCAGGIGCGSLAAFPHNNAIEVLKCMGSSIGIAHGYNKASNEPLVSIMGDGEFWHSGLNGLINTYYNRGRGVFIIQDNFTIAMTGGQRSISGIHSDDEKNRNIAIEDVVRAIGINDIFIVDGYNNQKLIELVETYYERPNITVIIARKECMLFRM